MGADQTTPPISDEALLERIREFVADAADLPVHEVAPDADMYTELGIDSLGTMAIYVDMAYEFDVPEPPDGFDFKHHNTARMLCAYVRSHGK